MGKKYTKTTWIAIVMCFAGLASFVAEPLFDIISKDKPDAESEQQVGEPAVRFDADSAFAFCQRQCDFGPRTMNSEAHDRCAQWIVSEFTRLGCSVEVQKADLKGFDGTVLKSQNIIARLNPEAENRILICAHWDSRPWADNDPDESNHDKPVMAANDGASGVAVMLELARTISQHLTPNTQHLTPNTQHPTPNTQHLTPNTQHPTPNTQHPAIDFVCFDAEDWGKDGDEDSWALGAQYWARNVKNAHQYSYGILLDMVGGEGARFYQEGMSLKYAPEIVSKVWSAASAAGYGGYFPYETGGYITDDHLPVNKIAGIPCIDIIPYYPDCQQSSFGPTWHTTADTMDHISISTLRAVGQTLVMLLLM